MSIISKISEALTILTTVIDFAEKVKGLLGVADSTDLTNKLAEVETVLTATQTALNGSASA